MDPGTFIRGAESCKFQHYVDCYRNVSEKSDGAEMFIGYNLFSHGSLYNACNTSYYTGSLFYLTIFFLIPVAAPLRLRAVR
jgi:hypothetical protein